MMELNTIFTELWNKSEQQMLNRFESMQKQLNLKLLNLDAKIDEMIKNLDLLIGYNNNNNYSDIQQTPDNGMT
ncbi:hypothetical protein Mgra_00005056, partial [Meloidogyne graminicola]